MTLTIFNLKDHYEEEFKNVKAFYTEDQKYNGKWIFIEFNQDSEEGENFKDQNYECAIELDKGDMIHCTEVMK